jgi:RNA polymerase sigma-70 factor (ECF subfamily)
MPINTVLLSKELREGKFEQFNSFVKNLKDTALALAYSVIKNQQEAEDIVQESFVKLYLALLEEKFKASASINTYFYRLVYNTSVDHYRKLFKKRLNILSIDINTSYYEEGSELQFELFSESTSLDKFNLNELITKYLDSLPPQYSVILTMHYVNELKHEEISEILGIPIGTVKNRLFRAREKFKTTLLKHFSESELLENLD